jgi:2-dehydropantoate 2-reductase
MVFAARAHGWSVRILVFGAGGIGSFIGGLLSRRQEVTLVARAEHVEAIQARGLRITGKTALIARPIAATSVPSNARPDFVFITTKAYDTASAMSALERFGERSIFVTLQNGLGNAETIARKARQVIAGTTTIGAQLIGPGEVRHAGIGETTVGAWSRVSEADLVRLRDVLAEAGIIANITSDVRTELWSKLVVNASINPLAAIAGVPNGRLVRDKRLFAVMEALIDEGVAVARAEGAKVDAGELRHRTHLVAKRTATNRASMLQDFDRHRRTEIDAITGSIVRTAVRRRIAVPLNHLLYAVISAREKATLPGS